MCDEICWSESKRLKIRRFTSNVIQYVSHNNSEGCQCIFVKALRKFNLKVTTVLKTRVNN